MGMFKKVMQKLGLSASDPKPTQAQVEQIQKDQRQAKKDLPKLDGSKVTKADMAYILKNSNGRAPAFYIQPWEPADQLNAMVQDLLVTGTDPSKLDDSGASDAAKAVVAASV